VNLFERALELTRKQINFVMITQIEVVGLAPQNVGAKMLVTQTGEQFFTVGGGKIEARAISTAREILQQTSQQVPQTYRWNLQTDIGMTCGGVVTFLFEHFYQNNFDIVIFGAGHVAQALTRVLEQLPCQVTCIDSREEWMEQLPHYSTLKKITHHRPSEVVASLNPKSFFLSMTMGHAHDVPILAAVAQHAPDCPYVGVIGSEIKGKKIKQELRELGIEDRFIEKLKVPIGLPVGSNHPYEIAISIVAELLQIRDA
jgi:xanthine dehydrogenase accessory factor